MVITNNYFTKNAENFTRSNEVELWARNKLISFMSHVRGQDLAKAIPEEELIVKESKLCPRCGGKLVIRNGSRGKFVGCSGFPKCRFTTDYRESAL